MDRKGFGFILLAGTVLLMAMGYGSGMMASGILNNVSPSTRRQVKLDKTVPEDIRIYTPRFYETDLYLAKIYADYFNINSPPQEADEFYLFANEKESLYVYKYISMIEYRLNSEQEIDMSLEDFKESDALKAAAEFITSKYLSLEYEDASVNLIDNGYEVKLMNRLGSLKNYGFPNKATVDRSGQIISLTYHFMTYEELGSIPVMSMQEAFYSLFVDSDKVVVNNCRMVYIYKNSILQPAYMFQGKTENAEYFESFVEAAFYAIDK